MSNEPSDRVEEEEAEEVSAEEAEAVSEVAEEEDSEDETDLHRDEEVSAGATEKSWRIFASGASQSITRSSTIFSSRWLMIIILKLFRNSNTSCCFNRD